LTQSFKVQPSATRPTTIGSIAQVDTEQAVLDGTPEEGICVDHLEGVKARVSSELRPFLPAKRLITKLDGQHWRTVAPDAASDRAIVERTAACSENQGFLTQGCS
jgi:hypothetical protein